MKQNYKIIKQKGPLTSKSNPGSNYWEVKLQGTSDRRMYTTYIDTEMNNFEHWIKILENPQTNYELGGLRIKNIHDRIVNADSRPKIISSGETTFGELFEILNLNHSDPCWHYDLEMREYGANKPCRPQPGEQCPACDKVWPLD